jgi:hypothetical protein
MCFLRIGIQLLFVAIKDVDVEPQTCTCNTSLASSWLEDEMALVSCSGGEIPVVHSVQQVSDLRLHSSFVYNDILHRLCVNVLFGRLLRLLGLHARNT